MKKLAMMGFALCAMGVFAAANDVLISFATPGVDTYANGDRVLDGERYALVWQEKGTPGAFAVNADGTTVNGTVVLVAPLAKDGKCPPVLFEVDAAEYAAKGYANGTFAVYLLDSRVSKTTLAQADANNMPMLVNSYAAATFASKAEGQGNSLITGTAVNGAAVGVKVEVAAPTIAAMKVEAGKVSIKVDGMSPVATYKIVTGSEVKDLGVVLPAKAEGDTFEFDAPSGGQFFKVVGERNF